jgi:D-alanyl-D-alanine carboxypeptidase
VNTSKKSKFSHYKNIILIPENLRYSKPRFVVINRTTVPIKKLFVALTAATIFTIVTAKAQNNTRLAERLDSLIQTTAPRKFNGVIQISKGKKTLYQKAYGYADLEKKIPLRLDDNFVIMSNSKQITAVLILLEMEKGNIDINATIGKYLPELSPSWTDSVTVHHLLNFTAGITEMDGQLLFTPGTDFKYGNTTYILLGRILEKVSGETYEILANGLFKRLRMNNTYCYNPKKIQKLVQGYRNNNNEMAAVNPALPSLDLVPAAGIISNVRDLAIWDHALHKGKILGDAAYQQMINYSITAQHIAFGHEKIGYGYGIRINDKTPPYYLGHTGGDKGYVSYKLYFPKEEINIIVLENQSAAQFEHFYTMEMKIKELLMESLLH